MNQNDLRTEFGVHKAYLKIKCFVSLFKHDELPCHCLDWVINDINAPATVSFWQGIPWNCFWHDDGRQSIACVGHCGPNSLYLWKIAPGIVPPSHKYPLTCVSMIGYGLRRLEMDLNLPWPLLSLIFPYSRIPCPCTYWLDSSGNGTFREVTNAR